MRLQSLLLLTTFASLSMPVLAGEIDGNWHCWAQASAKHKVPVGLLKAIAKTESNFNPKAMGRNPNGTYDIGLMQINSWWLAKGAPLERMGITKKDLYDPCLNLHVGAWVLRQNFNKFGRSWRAVGAYNASTEYKRVNYARKVHSAMNGGVY